MLYNIKQAMYVTEEELKALNSGYTNWKEISKGGAVLLYIELCDGTILMYSLDYIRTHCFVGTTLAVAHMCVGSFLQEVLCDRL